MPVKRFQTWVKKVEDFDIRRGIEHTSPPRYVTYYLWR
ncbi:unnamed protein product [Acanthoscelides obtectus]|uniref:Uncharacterized protein n=1 Tax=Acanthoscelides obtectus TaxID=200917 RepID=A0A9P0JSM4_ACAOB|nr:unnamed protein product [Acanthoscelides obtectus]CAK1673653.1 hypothetical protein AOBTE_LOCUS29406 [Acanthoscelides obtectus]